MRSAEAETLAALPRVAAGAAARTARRLGDDRLDVVVVCDHAHVSGGLAQVAHASARALRRRGHRVTFFAAVPPIDPLLIAADIDVVCLDQPDMLSDPSPLKAAGRALWNVEASRRLGERLGRLDPRSSVVHIHGWSKALSPSVVRAAQRSGLAVVQTMHDYVALCPNGALYDYVKERNCPLRPLSAACVVSNCDARHYGHKVWRTARHLAMRVSSGSAAIRDAIYMTERHRQILERHLAAGTTLHHVPNPVDIEDRGPANVADNNGFVCVGRISKEKGVVLLAEAARRAGLPVRFVGDGPARAGVEQTAPDATITGWIGNDQVVAALRTARALVFPSLWYETFGLTVWEALANGVPPVVSDNTVSADAIQHGVNGLLFRSGDIDDLTTQLQKLCDGRTAVAMGKEAHRRYWMDPPTLERHVTRLEETYEKVLSRRLLSGS